MQREEGQKDQHRRGFRREGSEGNTTRVSPPRDPVLSVRHLVLVVVSRSSYPFDHESTSQFNHLPSTSLVPSVTATRNVLLSHCQRQKEVHLAYETRQLDATDSAAPFITAATARRRCTLCVPTCQLDLRRMLTAHTAPAPSPMLDLGSPAASPTLIPSVLASPIARAATQPLSSPKISTAPGLYSTPLNKPSSVYRDKNRTRGKKRSAEHSPERNEDDEQHAVPSGPSSRPIAPLRSSSHMTSMSSSISISITPYRSPIASRDTSPVPVNHTSASGSSPTLKRPRTNSFNEIRNFHLLPSDDELSDTETSSSPIQGSSSPTVRCQRARFNQLLGPSPLQKSFSSPMIGRMHNLPKSSITTRLQYERSQVPPAPLSPANNGTSHGRSASAMSAAEAESASLPDAQLINKTKAKVLMRAEVEGLGVELDKVFALAYGKGLGMGKGGSRNRRGSALRPAPAQNDKENGVGHDSQSSRGFLGHGSMDVDEE